MTISDVSIIIMIHKFFKKSANIVQVFAGHVDSHAMMHTKITPASPESLRNPPPSLSSLSLSLSLSGSLLPMQSCFRLLALVKSELGELVDT